MAVKRVTIELDDSPDNEKSTYLPASLLGKERALPASREKTATPDQREDYQQGEAMYRTDISPGTEAIGRTPSDLVAAFINRPEFMATILTFLVFVVFISAGELQTTADFKVPILTSVILNSLWFGIIMIRHVVSWIRR